MPCVKLVQVDMLVIHYKAREENQKSEIIPYEKERTGEGEVETVPQHVSMFYSDLKLVNCN